MILKVRRKKSTLFHVSLRFKNKQKRKTKEPAAQISIKIKVYFISGDVALAQGKWMNMFTNRRAQSAPPNSLPWCSLQIQKYICFKNKHLYIYILKIHPCSVNLSPKNVFSLKNNLHSSKIQFVGILSPVNHKGLHQGQNKLQSVSYLLFTQVIKPQIP